LLFLDVSLRGTGNHDYFQGRRKTKSVRGGKKKNIDNERISDELQKMEQHIPQNNCQYGVYRQVIVEDAQYCFLPASGVG
jgi:hypothetical protein